MAVLGEAVGGFTGFEWDQGSSDKNWRRHRVRQVEAEQALLNRPAAVARDHGHSQTEPRFIALGVTHAGRGLTVVFTVRDTMIRVISARPMNRAERRIHASIQATEAGS